MSTTGFVHKMPGQPSEFISRSDWTRESSLFHVISNITFFKNYLMLKSFLIWRTHIRFKLYCQLRRRLAKNFFLARETFCAPLLAVQDAITDIQDVPLMTLERGGKAFKHNAFTEAQKTTQETSATTLESFVEKSYTVVKKVIHNIHLNPICILTSSPKNPVHLNRVPASSRDRPFFNRSKQLPSPSVPPHPTTHAPPGLRDRRAQCEGVR